MLRSGKRKQGSTYEDVQWIIEERYELAERICQDFGLTYSFGLCDDLYIGRSWDDIKDDETGAQFKADVQKKITDLIGADVEVGTMEEVWHD
jgi:hypothetical protein